MKAEFNIAFLTGLIWIVGKIGQALQLDVSGVPSTTSPVAPVQATGGGFFGLEGFLHTVGNFIGFILGGFIGAFQLMTFQDNSGPSGILSIMLLFLITFLVWTIIRLARGTSG